MPVTKFATNASESRGWAASGDFDEATRSVESAAWEAVLSRKPKKHDTLDDRTQGCYRQERRGTMNASHRIEQHLG